MASASDLREPWLAGGVLLSEDYLTEHNRRPASFYEEMQRKEKEKRRQREEAEKKEAEAARIEEEHKAAMANMQR